MISNRYNIDSFLDRILKQNNLNALIGDYDEMLSYNFNLSILHLKKVQSFINEFYIPMQSAPKNTLEEFNKSHYFTNLFKKLLSNLFTHSKKLNLLTLKEVKTDD